MFDDILDREEKLTEPDDPEKLTFDFNFMPRNMCPKHGDVGYHIISSTIPGIKGQWCMLCLLSKLDELGVCRVGE